MAQKSSFLKNTLGLFGAGSRRPGKYLHSPCSRENRRKLRLCSFMVSAKAQKPQEKKFPHHKINVWFDSLLKSCAEKRIRKLSTVENSTGYTLRKAIPKYPCQMQAAQPLLMFPRITLDVKVWKALKQRQYSGVGSWQLLFCELLSHFQWCPYGSLGTEISSGDRAQDMEPSPAGALCLLKVFCIKQE